MPQSDTTLNVRPQKAQAQGHSGADHNLMNYGDTRLALRHFAVLNTFFHLNGVALIAPRMKAFRIQHKFSYALKEMMHMSAVEDQSRANTEHPNV